MSFKADIINSTEFDDIWDVSIHIDDIKESKDVEWLCRVYSMLDESGEDCKDRHQSLHELGLSEEGEAIRMASKIAFMRRAMKQIAKRLWELDCIPPARLNSFADTKKLYEAVGENKRLMREVESLNSRIANLEKSNSELKASAS